jgi:hypothetical protein
MRVEEPELTLTMTLDPKEIKWLMDISQNPCGDETNEEQEIRKLFFFNTSQSLGYNMGSQNMKPRREK